MIFSQISRRQTWDEGLVGNEADQWTDRHEFMWRDLWLWLEMAFLEEP